MTFLFLKRRLKKSVNLAIFAGYIKLKTKTESTWNIQSVLVNLNPLPQLL